MVDCACLAAVTSLAWLRDGCVLYFFFPFAFEGMTDAGEEQMGCSPILDCAQPGFNRISTIIVVCFCGLAGERGRGVRNYGCYIFFLKKKKSHQFFNLFAKEMKVVADAGCCWLTAPPAPAAVRGRGVSCIYIYIYIYLYIYAFPFPVSHQ